MILLVSSYDRMCDSWLPFLALLRQLWPECPYRIRIITNKIRFDDGPVQAIALGEDAGWGSNLLAALDQLDDEHVFYFQEDHFLLKPVDQARIDEDFECLKSGGFDTLAYRAKSLRRANPGTTVHPEREELMIHPPSSQLGIYCDPSMWRVEALRQIVRPGESAWDFLKHGRERAAAVGLKRIHYRHDKFSRIPIVYFKRSGIREGLWKTDALWWLIRRRIPIWPLRRGLSLSSIKIEKHAEKNPNNPAVQAVFRTARLLRPIERWERRWGDRAVDRFVERYSAEAYPLNALLAEWHQRATR